MPEKGRMNMDGKPQQNPKTVVVVAIMRIVVPVAVAGGRIVDIVVPRPAPQDDPSRLTQPEGGQGQYIIGRGSLEIKFQAHSLSRLQADSPLPRTSRTDQSALADLSFQPEILFQG